MEMELGCDLQRTMLWEVSITIFYIIERAVTQTDTLICLVKFVGNGASTVAQMVNNLPIMQEICVLSPAQEDPLEKGMATHFSFLAWRIPWTEELGGLQSMGSQRVDNTLMVY